MKFTMGLAGLFAAALMSACSSLPAMRMYAGPPKPDSEIAIVKAVRNGAVDARFLGIRQEGGMPGTLVRFHADMAGYPVEVKLDPGIYHFTLRCKHGWGLAGPTVRVELARGRTYSLGCSDAGERNERALASVFNVETHAVE